MKPIKIEVLRRAATFALALAVSLSLLTGALPASKSAEASEKLHDSELYQALLDLQNPWTVMCVAAHPDDEDGATLTVLRRKLGVHTVTLFSTYGEGGQNAIGPELYEELGAIRAHETEEAARIQGSEPYFLGLKDFGFSKSAEEAFRVWGHDEALRRMVLKIRELRPDVIITNHSTTGGHGHHQATGRLVLEAFDAAADPKRFPEQLRGGRLQPWQVQRLFVRAGYEGATVDKALDEEAARAGRIITIERNERDPVRGITYAEQALAALRKHASQGPWPQTIPPAGWPPVRYRLAREAKGAAPFPTGAQTFLDNLSLSEDLANALTPLAVKALLPLYQGENVQRKAVLNALVSLRRSNLFVPPAGTKEGARFQLMNERLDHALAIAALVTAELEPKVTPVMIPGTEMSYSVLLHNGGDKEIEVKRSTLRVNGREAGANTLSSQLQSNSTLTTDATYTVPPKAAINLPQAEHLYDGRLFGEELSQQFTLELEGARFNVTASRRFDIAPPVEIESVTPQTLVVTQQTFEGALDFTFRLNNHTATTIVAEILSTQLSNRSRGRYPVVGIPPQTVVDKDASYQLSLKNIKAIREREALTTVEKFSIKNADQRASSQPALTERAVKVIYADARVAKDLRVGYVRSSDYALPNALAALGVRAKELTIEEIGAGNLQAYDAIIIDNRGYQAHAELISNNPKLMDYVERGGTMIVFYHKTNEWNVDEKANRPQLAPYPLALGNSRVTDERAPVSFLEPTHPLLNYPNKIGAADFQGWIQERGLYFPKEWDKRYHALLSMNDAGEQPLEGGLLAAEVGRGHYIYTSIVWYRQLREGVPGAYRMLANMISYGRAFQNP